MSRSFASIQSLLRSAAPPVFGFILGMIAIGYWLADPNSDYDPQAGKNLFCMRDEVSRVPSGGRWTAVAYVVDCDVLGNSWVVYIYLLRPGQVVSRATLVFRYEYEDEKPDLIWKDQKTLLIRARARHIGKQVTKLAGVTVEYELQHDPSPAPVSEPHAPLTPPSKS